MILICTITNRKETVRKLLAATAPFHERVRARTVAARRHLPPSHIMKAEAEQEPQIPHKQRISQQHFKVFILKYLNLSYHIFYRLLRFSASWATRSYELLFTYKIRGGH